MTNEQILEKAITKAIAGGWKPFEFGKPTSISSWQKNEMVEIAVVFPLHDDPVSWVRELEGIIFNHDFAKALWPPKELYGLGAIIDDSTDIVDVEGNKIIRNSYRGLTRSKPQSNDPLFELKLRMGDVLERWQKHLALMVISDDPIAYLGSHLDD